MSSFKPMVKMYTDEPSVSLKLKKGGKVKAKHHKEHEEHGHKNMQHHAMGGMHHAFESEAGKSPKKPSMAERRRAMNPNLYAKGGKVAHKGMGGGMMINPLAMATPAMAAKKAAMGNKAAGMGKQMMYAKGGSAHKAEMAEMHKIEKELKHHEGMKASKAHHGLKHGGKVHHISGHPEGSLEHHKHMAKHHAKMHKEGGSAHHKKMHEHHKAMCKGGSYASGGEIDKDMTKTTIEGNAKKFVNNIHDGEHADHTSGKTGVVKLGNAGGYKHGGKTKHHYAKGGRATGSSIPSETNESETRGRTEMGGTIEGNEHYYENTDMHTGRPFSGSKTTGDVRMGNGGGYKRGGKAHHMHHKADGGAIDKYETRNSVEGGNWENRPADTTPKGKTGTKTGEVKLANAGGFKRGGHATKKAYATGGNVNDMGKSVKMPKHFVSQPVANSLQSGTFARGGKVEKEDKPNLRLLKTHTGPKGHVAKVYKDRDWGEHRVKFFSPEGKHHAEGDYHTDDLSDAHDTAIGQLNRYKKGGRAHFADGGTEDLSKGAYDAHYADEKKENEAMRNAVLGAPKRAYDAVKSLFSSSKPPEGSVTKTEKSVTVAPPKRRGGSMRK